MSTIQIGNSYCRLQGFTSEALEVIADSISYEDEEKLFEAQDLFNKIKFLDSWYKKRKNTISGLSKKKIEWRLNTMRKAHYLLIQQANVCFLKEEAFPTGHLDIVERALKDAKEDFIIEDLRVKPKPRGIFKFAKPISGEDRYYQKAFHEVAIKEHRGVCKSAVGTGKSRMLENLIREFDQPSLIITPGADLSIQLKDSINESMGGVFAETISTPYMKQVESGKAILPPVMISTIQGLTALQKTGYLQNLISKVGFLAVDEVHHAGAKTYTEMLPMLDHIYYRFGFTGTFLRNDSKTLDMWGFFSKVLYDYPAHKAISDGFLTPIEAIVWEIEGKHKKKYQTEYTHNYCGGTALLSKILEICTTFALPSEQILILVNRKDKAGKVIHELLKEYGIDNTYISGDDKKATIKQALIDFNSKKIRILIGSTIIGEGIDIRSTDHLVMAQGGKSEIAITQAIGRLVRIFLGKKKGYIHDFAFKGTKYLLKHVVERMEIYEKNFAAEVYVET